MKTTIILVVLLALLFSPFFAIVNQDTVVYDGYGFIVYQGTIVRVLDRDAVNCFIAWDDHDATIPCSHLTPLGR